MTKAIFYNSRSYGHLAPTLGLVTELVRRGEEIIYYAVEEFRTTIEATGAIFRPYANLPAAVGTPTEDYLAYYLLQCSEALLPGLLEAARADQPDYILFDSMRPWGWQIAKALQLPAISSCVTFAFSRALFVLGHPRLFIPMLFGKSAQKNGTDYGKQYRRLAHTLQRRYGIPSPAYIRAINVFGDRTLLYTIPELQPLRFLLDNTFHFVGPCLMEKRDQVDFAIEQLAGRSVIYISLGTAYNRRLAFYTTCLQAFANSSYLVIMAVGNHIALDDLAPIPANFVVRRFVPQLEVLAHTRLFITHGGLNSALEGLYAGVPLLIAPQMFEQRINARQIVRQGAGLQIDSDVITPAELRSMADTMLHRPQFAQQAERLGRRLRTGGPTAAADAVQALVDSRRT